MIGEKIKDARIAAGLTQTELGSEQINEDSWVIAPMNSKLIRVEDNLNRKVESITVNGGMLQIWLANEDKG